MQATAIQKIKKRDGSIVDFDKDKITNAIFKAAVSVGGTDRAVAEKLADKAIEHLQKKHSENTIPGIEEIQDVIEIVLIEEGHVKTAKAFILYRQNRRELRQRKSLIIGRPIETDLSENALIVLKERYLRKDKEGKTIETPDELFWRVANNIAKADELYGKTQEDIKKTSQKFYDIISKLDFLPNSPTLMNAGNNLQQLSACFVLPIEDSMESIFETLKNTAKIHQSGGGTGFSFTRLRPKNDMVQSTSGVSSGPISFMKVFDAATEVIKQGGKRRGANMGILKVDHPDILDFIRCKEKKDQLNNFNISVGLTEEFMKAVESDSKYDIINPRDGKAMRKLPAKEVFELIVTMAWTNGEPGIIFLDRLNKFNPTPKIAEIESTNPCVVGESLVSTEKGLIKIEDMANEYVDGGLSIVTDNRVPITVESNGQKLLMKQKTEGVTIRPITKVYNNGLKEVMKLETKAGYELIATPEHKILTDDGWVEMQNLGTEHNILIQGGIGKFNENLSLPFEIKNEYIGNNGIKYKLNLPKEWSKEIGQVLGWLTGDGWLKEGKDCRVGFTFGKDSFEVLNYIKPIIDSFYGKKIKEIMRENNVIHLSYHSKYFVEFFKKLGIKAVKAKEKRVPESIFTAPEKTVTGFLQGLFTADGTVGKLYNEIRLTSSSERLLKDVQVLLINLGIKSKIYERKYSNSKPFTYKTKEGEIRIYESKGNYFELVIEGLGRKIFFEKIGFLNKKQEKLSNGLKLCKKIKFHDTVKSITPIGKRIVYDLTEPRTISFIANGIVVYDCGEQPLLPYESCNLGSINLTNFVKNKEIDFDRLRDVIRASVHFLDNVVDMNHYPLPQIEKMTRGNRKIGLGLMGFADLLIQVGVPYNSEEGIALGEKIMKFIDDEAKKMSQEIAKERGPFPNFKESVYFERGEPEIRNATRTTIAPTGTISMIAESSSGIEPIFSICFMKRVMDGKELLYINKCFERLAKERGFYSEELMKKIANLDSIHNIEEIPDDVKKVCVVAHDVTPEWHVKMQAAFQRHTDNAVSKTVNFPNSATLKEVEEVYLSAYKLGCKGVTIYRDGSRDLQVLNVVEVPKEKKETEKREEKKETEPKDDCPECGKKLKFEEGCAKCLYCGYSVCS